MRPSPSASRRPAPALSQVALVGRRPRTRLAALAILLVSLVAGGCQRPHQQPGGPSSGVAVNVLTPSSAASEPATAAAWNSTSGTSAARPGATGSASATTAAAQSGATPGPSASPSSTASAAPRSYFLDHRVVAFYGNPLSPILGILGDGEPEQVVTRLRAQADAYARLDSTRQVTPALELIEAVAQDTPTDNGLYLYYTEPGVVDHFAGLAADNNMLLILDEQIGRSSPDAETRRMLPRLASPLVGLALDPEFEMKPGEVPGRELGSIDAAEINSVQAMLEELAVRQGLPSKLLIIHQFQLDMITHLDQLRRYPHVDLVLDADGFGTRSIKTEKYQALITNRPAGRAGVKLFYKYDPNIWTPADVLQLDPPPDFIVYQ